MLLRALTHLSPNHALITFTAGLLLVYLELNRPGWIIPGSIGLLLTLFSVFSLLQDDLRTPAATLTLTAIALLFLNLFRPTHVLVPIAATIALILGFTFLVSGPSQIVLPLAVPCALILGLGTSLLTTIARRARANKRVRLT
jgi:membrane-bound serine protease (ClpP class)